MNPDWFTLAALVKDHAAPHFHAVYGDFEVKVEIRTGVVEGHFPK